MSAIFKWLSALIAGAIGPALLFEIYFIDMPWTVTVQPEWVWATVAILPLAGGLLLFLSVEGFSRIVRPVCLALVLHMISMVGSWYLGIWPSVAIISLTIDFMLLGVLVVPAIRLRAGRFAKATIFWMAVIFGLGIPIGCAYSFLVIWRAEEIAGDRPYCIQYASQSDTNTYKPARTLFDISALKMRTRLVSGGSSMFFWQNHGMLVVGETDRQFLNWSYMHGNFLDEVVNRRSYVRPEFAYQAPTVVCEVSAHYAPKLPAWSPSGAP